MSVSVAGREEGPVLHAQISRALGVLVTVVAVAMTVYQVYVAATVSPVFFIQYPAHLGFALAVLFLRDLKRHWDLPPGVRRRVLVLLDVVFLAMTVGSTGYLVLNADLIDNRMVWFEPLTTAQIVGAVSLVIALTAAAQRTVGTVLAVLLFVFIAYVFVGPYLPEPFWHRGQGFGRLLELFYLTPDGIFNVPLKVTADYIFLFVLFGALLMASGAGRFFTDLAYAITGRMVGGPAKTAVVSSALMGMLQGSSAGNVVTTGPFTIPAMRRSGYTAPFAAAVEAVASSGGQITPPIMGGAAFLMSEIAGIHYGEIIQLAVIPALLYYLAVLFTVDLEARRLRLPLPQPEDLPGMFAVLRKQGYLLLSVVILVWFLLEGYTPTKAGFWALVALVVLIAAFDSEQRRRIFQVMLEAAREAPEIIVPVTVACAIGGMIAGIIVMTGLGLKGSSIILDFAAGRVLVALVLTMIVCVILGMGMPTSAAYIILAALLAPGLANMGIPLAAAHFFIVFCAAKSSITPPVAVASYAAAAIAQTDPWRTSLVAFKLGLSIFIIPYMFVFGPELLGFGSPIDIAISFVTATIGIFALSVATAGWFLVDLRIHERVLAFVAAIPMMYPGWESDVVGILLLGLLYGLVSMRRRALAAAAGT